MFYNYYNTSTQKINTNLLIEKIDQTLKKRQIGDWFMYKQYLDSTGFDFYQSITGVLSLYVIGRLDIKNIDVQDLKKFITKHATDEEGYIYFKNPHGTAILYSLLNVLSIAGEFKLKKINDFNQFISILEKEVNWDGTLKDLWGVLWMNNNLLKNFSTNQLKDLEEYLNLKFNYVFENMLRGDMWEQISKVYHFISAIEATNIPYPQSKKVINFLIGLNYPKYRKPEKINQCTDFDYSYALWKYSVQSKYKVNRILKIITKVAKIRVEEYVYNENMFDEMSTSYIYNYLVGTGVFQQLSRELFTGVYLPDILNRPELFRNNYI